MHRRAGLSAALWLTLGLAGTACRSDPVPPPSPPPPPPLPAPPSLPTPPAEPVPGEEARGEAPEAPATQEAEAADEKAGKARNEGQAAAKTASAGASLYDLVKSGQATMPASPSSSGTPATASTTTPKTQPARAPTPAPATPAPAPAPKPATKVTVPSTAHVRVEVPSGLQATLDRDPRMQPWLNKAISVIDDCYGKTRAKDPTASGVVTAQLTMHSESRPSADLGSVPASLSSVVVCATGGLMGLKMPLFTGKEGERFTIRVHFQ